MLETTLCNEIMKSTLFISSTPINAENGMIFKIEIKVPIKHITIVIQLLPCSRAAAAFFSIDSYSPPPLSYAGHNR